MLKYITIKQHIKTLKKLFFGGGTINYSLTFAFRGGGGGCSFEPNIREKRGVSL
jgi:hypothetical protein